MVFIRPKDTNSLSIHGVHLCKALRKMLSGFKRPSVPLVVSTLSSLLLVLCCSVSERKTSRACTVVVCGCKIRKRFSHFQLELRSHQENENS